MKKLFGLIVAFLFVVNIAGAQMLVYADSVSDLSISRADQAKTSFRQYWWGPFDVSECWSTFNTPALITDTDTLVFRGYLSGIINYGPLDTVLGTWNAFLCAYPSPPQNEAMTLTWPFNWSDPDSLAYWKVRAAADTVSSKIDGFPVYSRFSIQTVASDTVTFPYLYIRLDLDSTTGTPLYSNTLDLSAYWTYSCELPPTH